MYICTSNVSNSCTEQYDAFVKFSHDQIERRLSEAPLSCESVSVCLFVCQFVCVCIGVYVCIVCVCVCTCVCACVYVYAHVCLCMCVYIVCVCTSCMCVHVHKCVCVCTCVCEILKCMHIVLHM